MICLSPARQRVATGLLSVFAGKRALALAVEMQEVAELLLETPNRGSDSGSDSGSELGSELTIVNWALAVMEDRLEASHVAP